MEETDRLLQHFIRKYLRALPNYRQRNGYRKPSFYLEDICRKVLEILASNLHDPHRQHKLMS